MRSSWLLADDAIASLKKAMELRPHGSLAFYDLVYQLFREMEVRWATAERDRFEQTKKGDDARRTSHPIQHPIADETEAMAAFDAIVYNKGQAFIRMLESYLGEDAFATGIRAYMRRHAYSNTTTADLWSALEAASGKPVAAMAAAYTEQAGVPLDSFNNKAVGRATCLFREGSKPSSQFWRQAYGCRCGHSYLLYPARLQM